jgi:hypothetical protein
VHVKQECNEDAQKVLLLEFTFIDLCSSSDEDGGLPSFSSSKSLGSMLPWVFCACNFPSMTKPLGKLTKQIKCHQVPKQHLSPPSFKQIKHIEL